MRGCQRVFGRICRETYDPAISAEIDMICFMNKSYSKQISNREVNGSVNAAQTKGVLSPEGQLRTNLSATVDLRKNENLEHNSSMIKNHKNKQNINREVNGNVNAAQTKNDVREFLHAALQGDAETQCYLGAMYANGDGVPKDSAKAAYWCRKAAEQGFAAAQFFLGGIYRKGEGVPKDLVQAHVWFNIAGVKGNDDAKKALVLIEKQMSGSQKKKAMELARELFAKLPTKK